MRRISEIDVDAGLADTDSAPVAARTPAAEPIAAPVVGTASVTATSTLDVFGGIGTYNSGGAGSIADQVTVPGGGVYAQVSENDFIVGTDNGETIDAGIGDDLVYAAGGDDTVIGGGGHDTLAGGNGHDTIHGDDGADWLLGEAGNDKLFGGIGNDRLSGGDGDDELNGGRGADVMTGGDGHDRFVVGSPQNGGYYAPPVDTITDFTTSGPNADVIAMRSALLGTRFFLYNDPATATIADAFEQGYIGLGTHGTPGQPGHGTTIWIDSNGSLSGGEVYAVAEINGVSASQLALQHGHFFVL
jgi:Ca2+-binding RTX toxin-like protein